jgi:RNA polymerase sigma factor (sigma-70 family)
MRSNGFQAVLDTIRHRAGLLPTTDLTDGQLLECYLARRDEAALAQLIDRYGPLVLGLCRRLLRQEQDAEDVFQATFLLLVRKAGSIARPESVGSWLYGVAYRLAHQVKADAARRRTFPGELPEVAVEDLPDLEWQDVGPVLDEEINGLPEHYRAPFVLCHLQGKTNEEAAHQLGCAKGTVLSRLARARERLRARLSRRGVTLSGAAVTALVLPRTLNAVSAPLRNAVLRAGQLAGSPSTLAGAVSVRVLLLTEGVLRTVTVSNWAAALILVVALAVLGCGAWVAAHQGPGDRLAETDSSRAGLDPACAGGWPGGAGKPAESGTTDPLGVPLELRFVADEATCVFVPRREAGLPVAEVDLKLRVRNTSGQNVRICVADFTREEPQDGGDYVELTLDLRGLSANQTEIRNTRQEGAEPGRNVITLGPGEFHDFSIRNLSHGRYGRSNTVFRRAWWTRPGFYTLQATLRTAVSPAPVGTSAPDEHLRDFGTVTLRSQLVRLDVVPPTPREIAARVAPLGSAGAKVARVAFGMPLPMLMQNVRAGLAPLESEPALRERGTSVPAGAPLRARLRARKDTYTLDLGGRTPEEFRRLFRPPSSWPPPPPPGVDLVLELSNTGDEPIQLCSPAGDGVAIGFILKGPGVFHSLLGRNPTRERFSPNRDVVTLAPHEKKTFPIERLLGGSPMPGAYQSGTYWTRAGDYTLMARFATQVNPAPLRGKSPPSADGFGRVWLTTPPIKLTVVEQKPQ